MKRGIRTLGIVAVVVGATLALAGCFPSAAPAAKPTATAVAQKWQPVSLTSVGEGSAAAAAPDGSKSIELSFACSSGFFVISLGTSSDAQRTGQCGGTRQYRLAFPKLYDGVVHVSIAPKTAVFTLRLEYSADAVRSDASVAAQCEALSAIESAVVNAKGGHDAGEVTAKEWSMALGAAASGLDAIDDSGLMGPVLTLASDALTAAVPHPASLYVDGNRYGSAMGVAGQVCDDNGTPVSISAAYGG
jgi:hypothetical protein